MHRCEDFGMLAHAEIIVRTPNRHFMDTVISMTRGAREWACMTLEDSKNALATLGAKCVQPAVEIGLVVHVISPPDSLAVLSPPPSRFVICLASDLPNGLQPNVAG